jgi:predicted short-subunit dehydrogenase-like oxidoreductase (DUF2520 family)
VHLAGFTARTAPGRAKAESWLGSSSAVGIHELVSCQPDIYVVAVPDHELPRVAEELANEMRAPRRPKLSQPLVLHTSGATSVEVLGPCAKAGAMTLVFHPLQTFADPASGSKRFDRAAVAITPGSGRQDGPELMLGFALARLLGAQPFFLPDERRTLYHAAATVACNYLVTLEYLAQRLFVRAGLAEDQAIDLFLPLVIATLENVRDHGPVAALTGPLSRGDSDTVAKHLEALASEEPPLVLPYRVLGLATLDLVRARGEIDPQVVTELGELLGGPLLPFETIRMDKEHN